jgi:hypothetical protein
LGIFSGRTNSKNHIIGNIHEYTLFISVHFGMQKGVFRDRFFQPQSPSSGGDGLVVASQSLRATEPEPLGAK